MSASLSAPAAGVAANGLALSAAERLALSRERLRQALHTTRAPPGTGPLPATGPATALLERLRANPAANLVIAALELWWMQHPWRLAGRLIADAATALVQPVARRNPLGLVLGAMLAGGLFAWSRPWRWLPTPALLAGLVAQVPLPSWMALLASLAPPPRKH